ncbi:MAG: hypothetical protein RIT45_3867, partial [Pseudomonadota bacterium]
MWHLRRIGSALAMVLALTASPVVTHAATPTTSRVEGLLLASGGAPAADGEYEL